MKSRNNVVTSIKPAVLLSNKNKTEGKSSAFISQMKMACNTKSILQRQRDYSKKEIRVPSMSKFYLKTEANEHNTKIRNVSKKPNSNEKKIFYIGLQKAVRPKKSPKEDLKSMKSSKRMTSECSIDKYVIKSNMSKYTSFLKKTSPRITTNSKRPHELIDIGSVDKQHTSTRIQSFITRLKTEKDRSVNQISPMAGQMISSLKRGQQYFSNYADKLKKIVTNGRVATSLLRRPRVHLKIHPLRLQTSVDEESRLIKCQEMLMASDKTKKPLKSLPSSRKHESVKNSNPKEELIKNERNFRNTKKMTLEKDLLFINSEKIQIEFQHETFKGVFEDVTLEKIIEIEMNTFPSYMCLRNHPELKWEMRAILIDWITEVCSEYSFKRDTLHIAINFLDRFLEESENLSKDKLQLVGAVALFLAAKMEEVYTPKLESILMATSGLYTEQEFLKFETTMIKRLSMNLSPSTLCLWGNWYSSQWDSFIEESPKLVSNQSSLVFRFPNESSYSILRNLYALIDCLVLDLKHLHYKPRAIVASLLYLLLGCESKQFTRVEIYQSFPFSSGYISDQSLSFNTLFEQFTNQCFGFSLSELLPTIQYVSLYFELEPTLKPPPILEADRDRILQGHFEEFLAYQTHAPESLNFVLHTLNHQIY